MSAKNSGKLGKLKVLLVDDQLTQLRYLRMLMGENDYEFREARSGEQALEMVQEAHPDLILLDIVMPGINGLQVLQKLHSKPDTAQIPVIMVTTRGEEEYLENAYEKGCGEYVTKPVAREELLMKIEAVVSH